jgi:two-component system sensor histidine kinase HydH
LLILIPIFVFWTIQSLHKQKEDTIRLLVEKGAALIRSFEAGTRTGMMGMMGMRGAGFRLQNLLTETAQEPDIVYLMVVDAEGTILAHSDREKSADHGKELDLKRISSLEKVEWRQVQSEWSRYCLKSTGVLLLPDWAVDRRTGHARATAARSSEGPHGRGT